MASNARQAFDDNTQDIDDLLSIAESYVEESSDPDQLEVLNKSAIVLITAYWEAYCEDIASEALKFIAEKCESAEKLPKRLKQVEARSLKDDKHELKIWDLADDGWREHLMRKARQLSKDGDRTLDTPNATRIDEMFEKTIGLEKSSDKWVWPGVSATEAKDQLSRFISLRGAIAHRGKSSEGVTGDAVREYLELVRKLAAKTGGRVTTHVKSITGKPLFESRKRTKAKKRRRSLD